MGRFFIDLFCLRQWSSRKKADFVLSEVQKAITTIGHTILIADPPMSPYALSRVFCVYEAFYTIDAGGVFEIQMPPGTAPLPDNVTEALCGVSIDVDTAECRNAADKDELLRVLRETPGGTYAVNKAITESLRILIVEAAWKQTRVSNQMLQLLREM